MWGRCAALMDDAFENFYMEHAVKKDAPLAEIAVEKGKRDKTGVCSPRDFDYPLKKDKSERIEIHLNKDKSITAPAPKGKTAGELTVTLDNRLLFSGKIVTMESVERKTARDKIKEFFKGKDKDEN
jgi:D-alanyl-D-alanine carboxypeptidase